MNAELFKPLKICFKVFKVLGLWQDGTQSWTYFITGFIFHFFIIYVFFAGEILYAFFEAKDLIEFIDVLGLSTAFLAVIAKSINLFMKLKNVKQSVSSLEHLLKFSAIDDHSPRLKLQARIDFVIQVYKVFVTSAWLTCFSGIFVPIFTGDLPYKVWFPFDTKNSSTGFMVGASYMVTNSFVASLTDMTLDILPVVFMTYAIGLIDELADRFTDMGKAKNLVESKKYVQVKSKLVSEELRQCVELQQKIKKFVEEIQENFSSAIFVQALLSSVILCTNAFTLSQVC